MVEQREGELLGPVDWTYDFDTMAWSDTHGGVNPEIIARGKETLKFVETGMAQGKSYTVYCYGLEQKVISIGMYDGWPFWKPTPSVYLETFWGGEWHPFYNISNAREIK